MSLDITPGDGIVGELELLGDLIVGGFPEAVFTLPGVNVDEVLDHARLYLGFAEAAQAAHARVRGLEVPEFVGVEGEFFRGRVPGEVAMQLGAAVDSYSRVGSGIKELARELDASQAALKPLEARARAVFEHMQKVWVKVNVPFTEYSELRSQWDELVHAAGVVHERVAAAGQQAAAAINAGTEAMVPVNDYFSTLPGGAVAGGVVARGVRSTASRAVSSAGGVARAPGKVVKAGVDGLGAAAGAVTSVPQQVGARGQQLASQVTPDGIKAGDQLLTDPTSPEAQKLVRDGLATNILGMDPTGVPTAMMMLASPNTLIREQPRKKTARRWTDSDQGKPSTDNSLVGQVVSVPGRFVGGAVDRFGNTIAGNAALIGVGGDPVRAWSGLLSNATNPVAGAGRAVASATPEQILADPIAAAGSAATHAPAAVPFVGWAYGLVEAASKPGELAREGARESLEKSLDEATAKNLQAGQAVANTSEVQVTTSDVDVHADNGGYVTFTLPDLEGGEPKAWYILATPDSPGNFTTNVATGPDEQLIERSDGSVILTNTVTGETVRTIKTPWAKDALGREQPTWYTIEKIDDRTSTITQHIAPNKGALYPLIADSPDPGGGGASGEGGESHNDSPNTPTTTSDPAAELAAASAALDNAMKPYGPTLPTPAAEPEAAPAAGTVPRVNAVSVPKELAPVIATGIDVPVTATSNGTSSNSITYPDQRTVTNINVPAASSGVTRTQTSVSTANASGGVHTSTTNFDGKRVESDSVDTGAGVRTSFTNVDQGDRGTIYEDGSQRITRADGGTSTGWRQGNGFRTSSTDTNQATTETFSTDVGAGRVHTEGVDASGRGFSTDSAQSDPGAKPVATDSIRPTVPGGLTPEQARSITDLVPALGQGLSISPVDGSYRPRTPVDTGIPAGPAVDPIARTLIPWLGVSDRGTVQLPGSDGSITRPVPGGTMTLYPDMRATSTTVDPATGIRSTTQADLINGTRTETRVDPATNTTATILMQSPSYGTMKIASPGKPDSFYVISGTNITRNNSTVGPDTRSGWEKFRAGDWLPMEYRGEWQTGDQAASDLYSFAKSVTLMATPQGQVYSLQQMLNDPQTATAWHENRYNDLWHQSATYFPASGIAQSVTNLGKAATNTITGAVGVATAADGQPTDDAWANLRRRGGTLTNETTKFFLTDYNDPTKTTNQKIGSTLAAGLLIATPIKGIRGADAAHSLAIARGVDEASINALKRVEPTMVSSSDAAKLMNEFSKDYFDSRNISSKGLQLNTKGAMGELLSMAALRNEGKIAGLRFENRFPFFDQDPATGNPVRQITPKTNQPAQFHPDITGTEAGSLRAVEAKFGEYATESRGQRIGSRILETLGINIGPRGTNPNGIPISAFPREMRTQLDKWLTATPPLLDNSGTVIFDRHYWAKEIAANPALLRQSADLATEFPKLSGGKLAASGLREIADQIEAAVRDNPSRYHDITPAQIKLAAAIIYAESQTNETR